MSELQGWDALRAALLPDFLGADADFRDRFQHEAIAVANLRHPNIPAVYHYGHQGDTAYIVTEFIDGGTLADQPGTPLPLPYTIAMLAAVASAVDHAHSRGVLPRDHRGPRHGGPGRRQSHGVRLLPAGSRGAGDRQPHHHPELFVGNPFTLTMDSEARGSFSVHLNQEQVANFDGGHPSPTGSMAFEAFGSGEFPVLSLAAYQRP